MLISFQCPKCLHSSHGEVTASLNGVTKNDSEENPYSSAATVGTPSTKGVRCNDCGWTKPTRDEDIEDETPKRCLICGCDDLWRQKDFSPKVGVTVVAIGIAISTYFYMQMRPELSIGVLMAFALADMIMFAVMKDCLVCYRCHARYRQAPKIQQVPIFDLEVNERYRQEAIRLKQAEQKTSS